MLTSSKVLILGLLIIVAFEYYGVNSESLIQRNINSLEKYTEFSKETREMMLSTIFKNNGTGGINYRLFDLTQSNTEFSIAAPFTTGLPMMAYTSYSAENIGFVFATFCDDQQCENVTSKLIAKADFEFSPTGNVSMAIGIDGKPFIAFSTAQYPKVYYVHCNDEKCASVPDPVPSTTYHNERNLPNVLGDVIMQHDHNITISYSRPAIGYSKCSNVNCRILSDVHLLSFEEAGYAVASTAGPLGPIFAYFNGNKNGVSVIVCPNIECSGGLADKVVDSNCYGSDISIDVDPVTGFPVVSYVCLSNGNKELRVTSCSDKFCVFPTKTLIAISELDFHQPIIKIRSDRRIGLSTIAKAKGKEDNGALMYYSCMLPSCSQLTSVIVATPAVNGTWPLSSSSFTFGSESNAIFGLAMQINQSTPGFLYLITCISGTCV